MKHKITSLFIFGTIFLTNYSFAQDFDQLWKSTKTNSLSGKSYQQKLKAVKIAEDRYSKHWFPKLYLKSSVFQTDDPTYSFMGTLNQREIEQADFSPSELNNPDMKQYQQHTLGAYLPLYEGGAKHFKAKSKKHEYEATKAESLYNDVKLYAQLAHLYGMYINAETTLNELNLVESEINQVLKNYKIGSKRNPLGRSGLLGLKTLKTKVSAQKDQLETMKASVVIALKELTGLKTIEIKKEQIDQFVSSKLANKISDKDQSLKVKSLKKMKEVANAHKKAAKAYYLPQVGVFAQNNYYAGDRDEAQSQMIGLSVKWEFFNLTTLSATKEAGAQAMAAEAYAKAIAQKELIDNQMNQSKEKVIKKNIQRIKLALKDMQEQTKINYRLFRNGIINVLQLAQVLDNKVDLISHYDQASNEYLKTWTQLFINKANENF